MKVCSSCHAQKPFEEFYLNKSSKDGRSAWCSACNKAYNAAYRAKNADKHKAYNKQWRADNKDKHDALTARWREANPERVAETKRAWQQANQEHLRQRVAERKASDPAYASQTAERLKRWKSENPDKVLEYEARRRAAKVASPAEKVDLSLLTLDTCGICGLSIDASLTRPDPMSKSLDHIVPLSRGGSHTVGNLQWAHLVCNMRKGNRTGATPVSSSEQNERV